MPFTCYRCSVVVMLADNERPWAVTRFLRSHETPFLEVPLCLECINILKPFRYAALGAYPFFQPPTFIPLTEYPKMAATRAQFDTAMHELFGNSDNPLLDKMFSG